MAQQAVPGSAVVQQAILQTLYALFLGGIITAFLVVGLNTFYGQPTEYTDRIAALDQRESEIYQCKETGGTDCPATAQEQAELADITREREELWALQDQQRAAWARNAGLALVAMATVLLALSLIRWDRAIVISNGLLLGGLFTMAGGIGLVIAGGEGLARFLVMGLALALTVGLGYLRFARRPAGATPTAGTPAADTSGLERRVAGLEATLDDLRRALGG